MKIIFICKYNAFRSRVAELYFNKLNKKIKAVSRGFIMGGEPDKIQVGIAKKLLGIDITKVKQKPVNLWELIDADKIIVVASDIPMKMFDYHLVNLNKKVEIWKIKDEQRQNKKNIKQIVLQIKRKVERLNRRLR
jgi:protein-tyrosine-phosphatase